jgi:hypothetical protein
MNNIWIPKKCWIIDQRKKTTWKTLEETIRQGWNGSFKAWLSTDDDYFIFKYYVIFNVWWNLKRIDCFRILRTGNLFLHALRTVSHKIPTWNINSMKVILQNLHIPLYECAKSGYIRDSFVGLTDMSGMTIELTVWNLESLTKRGTTGWKLCYFRRLGIMWRGAFQYGLERFTVKGDECHICDLWWRLLQLNTIDTLCHVFGCNALLEVTAVCGSSTVTTDEIFHCDCNCSGLFLFESRQGYQLFG